MRVVRAILIVLLGMGLSTVAGAQEPAGAPTFRSGVEVVSLSVTVLDGQKRFVGDLGRDAFEVFEDGVRQELRYFETSDVPLDLALLIDASVSMTPKLAFVRQAAAGLLARLRPDDRAAVLAFNDHVHVLSRFSAEPSARQALDQVQGGGGTALYNAVYVALREFGRGARADEPVRRRAIVLLSDGEDTASALDFESLLDEARRAGVTIYTIGLRTPDPLLGMAGAKTRFSGADWAMRRLATETGATAHFPACEADLEAAYADIGRELGQQYAIGYLSSNPMRDGAFRRVVVRVATRPDLRPRTRPGYVSGSTATLAHAR